MKNLFAINKTGNKEATDLDGNPYVVAHVSDEVRSMLEHAFDDVTADMEPEAKPEDAEETRAIKRLQRRNWIICMSALVAAMVLFFAGESTGIFTATPVLNFIPIALLVVSIVFNFKARRQSTRLRENTMKLGEMDIEAATARLEEASAAAARELGVPENAERLEVLPYHYKIKDGVAVDAARKNTFDNIIVSAWVKDGALHLASAQELFRIPLSDIRGHREIDEEFTVDFWLQEEESDSERYAAFGIRRSGFLARKCRLFHAVTLSGAHGDYEFFVPCYAWELCERLIKTK